MKVERLSWDSQFFGLEVGKLTVSAGQRFSPAGGSELMDFDLVYVYAKALQSHPDLELFDTKLVFTRRTSHIERKQRDDVRIMSTQESNADATSLDGLAVRSGIYSRFRLDPRIPEGKFEELYLEWIRKSVSGELALEVLVAEREGRVVGLSTLGRRSADLADIGLISVATEAEGCGIGSALALEAVARAHARGFGTIQVATQERNVPAVKLYERTGFSLTDRTHVYHYWKR